MGPGDLKGTGEAELRVVDEFGGGVGWIAYPDELLERASHALSTDEGVYVVDPVDADGVDDLLAERGEVAGVLVLLDRHTRDSAALARRHGVAVHVPAWMDGVARTVDAPTERLGGTLGSTGYEVRRLADNPLWREAALYHPDAGTLLTPEMLGTATHYRTRDERVGVHPLARIRPPRRLADLDVERLLVGHGAGVLDDAGAAIDDAIDGARRRAPSLYLDALRSLLS